MTQKVNLYINSKFKKKDETNSKLKVVIPAGLLNLQGSDYYTLSVNGFYMFNSFYQLNKNRYFLIYHKDTSGNVTAGQLKELTCLGNPNVYDIRNDLIEILTDIASVTYDKLTNTFIYVRQTEQSNSLYKLYISCINCGNFLGFDNNEQVEVTYDGTESYYPVNVIAHTQLLFNIDGDVQLPQNNLDNTDTICTPNSILFYKSIDQQKNKLLTYDNVDGNSSFQYRLTATETINQFVITVTNQNFEEIDDLPDWQMCLQFQKNQEDNTESLLTQIKEYLRYIFLSIANYIQH
jgi:hypothetical protein